MASLSIAPERQDNPGKTDEQIAELLAKKMGYHVVLAYKNSSTASDYTDFALCKTQREVQGYHDSQWCHDIECLYDDGELSLSLKQAKKWWQFWK